MKKHHLRTQISPFLFSLICVCPVSGQVRPNLSAGSVIASKTVKNGQPKIIRTQGMVYGNVLCELQDKAGNIWFSTGGEGVYRYNGEIFINFTTKDGLPDNNVHEIIETRAGNILFSTKSGICKYDGRSFSKYTANTDFNKITASCLLEDSKGNLWLGTMNNGVYRYDGKHLTNFLNNGDHPFNDGRYAQTIVDIFEDKNGHIWFCSWNRGGAWRYDGKTFTNYLPFPTNRLFVNYMVKDQSQANISDDMIYSVTEDKAGNLWFATRRHGACRYNGKTFTSFRENEGFISRGVYSILEDRKGNIWLTTEDNGVWCYNGKTFKNYTTSDGLVNNSVFSVLEDRNGNLWFGTRGFGLSRYDGKHFTTFSE